MSNIVTIAVSSTGQTCSDSIMGQDLIAKLAAGQSVNFAWTRLEGGAGTGDWASATFNSFNPSTAKLASYGVSSGYCMAMEWGGFNGLFPDDLTLPYLKAGGALTLQGPTGTFSVPEYSYPTGTYASELTNNGVRGLVSGSTYTLIGPGGADVGAFTTTHAMPILGASISNINQFATRPRNADLTITWNPSLFSQPNGVATLGGVSEILDSQGSVIVDSELECTVPVAPGQFTIPAWVLSLLPPSSSYLSDYPNGYLWLGQFDTPTAFTASGLDKGLVSGATFWLTEVGFQ